MFCLVCANKNDKDINQFSSSEKCGHDILSFVTSAVMIQFLVETLELHVLYVELDTLFSTLGGPCIAP